MQNGHFELGMASSILHGPGYPDKIPGYPGILPDPLGINQSISGVVQPMICMLSQVRCQTVSCRCDGPVLAAGRSVRRPGLVPPGPGPGPGRVTRGPELTGTRRGAAGINSESVVMPAGPAFKLRR